MSDLNHPLKFGYQFKPSEYLSKGYQLLKTCMGPLVGMTLLYFVIQIVLSSIPFLNLISGLVNTILYSGFFIYLAHLMRKEEDSSHFFKGFQFVFDIVLHRLVFFAFILPFILIIFALGFPVFEIIEAVAGGLNGQELERILENRLIGNSGAFMLGILLIMIAVIYLSVSYLFTIPLIVNYKMGFWPAMELSRKVVGKHFFGFLFSVILFGLMVIIPIMITCGIAALFAVPLYYCAVHVAYIEIFKPDNLQEKSDLEQFGQTDFRGNSETDFR